MHPRIYVQLSIFPKYVWEVVQEGKVLQKFESNEALQNWWRDHGFSLDRLTRMMRSYIKAINENSV